MLKPATSLAVSAALAATAAAQSPIDAQIQFHDSVKVGSYDLMTGRATLGQLVPDGGSFLGSGPAVSISNENFSGSFATLGSNDVEYVDWGKLTLPANLGGFSSPPVTEFVIGYASTTPDAPEGVVDLEVAFFTENNPSVGAVGDCNQANYPGVGRGVEVARFLIDSLPGDTTPGDGLADAYAFTITVPPALSFGLKEGSVGIGYRVLSNPLESGVLLTIPADVSGCLDPNTVTGSGTSDCFDIYDIAGTTFTCNTGGPFVFGDGLGGSAGIASFFYSITQDVTDALPAAVRTGAVPNAGTLTPGVDVFVTPCGAASPSGQPCPDVTVSTTLATPLTSFWALSATSTDLALPGLGSVLIGITGGDPFLTLTGATGASIPFGDLPANPNFIGLTIFTQGGTIDASFQIELTNALDYTVGGIF